MSIKFNQSGFFHLIVVIFIIFSLFLGILLVHKPHNLFSKAVTNPEIVYDSNTVVVLVKFVDSSTTTLSKNLMEGIFFTNQDSVKKYYEKNSYGKISVNGTVVDFVQLPFKKPTAGDCVSNEYVAPIHSLLNAQGISIEQYKNIVYIWSDDLPNCGVAYVSGNSLFLNNGEYWATREHVLLHEFGHLISPRFNNPSVVGVGHASFLRCSGKVDLSVCQKEEYGDRYSRMGAPYLFNIHGVHKYALGWLSQDSVQVVSSSGIYTIKEQSSDAEGVKLLKIRKPNTEYFYYLEYRPDIDYDPHFNEEFSISLDKARNGVMIRLWNDKPEDNTLLIDTTPETITPLDNKKGENSDEALFDGQLFSDVDSGISIKQISHDESHAVVEITLSSGGNPSLTLPDDEDDKNGSIIERLLGLASTSFDNLLNAFSQ
jgi:hypothetical protein